MLAIIIPYYKLTFFAQTLESLANQTDKHFTVYIGNDASPEDPSDLLEKYKGKFDFVYHRFEKNLGAISLTKQWDRCIELSENEGWIMILGDDDVLGENVVASWYENNKIFTKKSNLVRFASKIIDEEMQSLSEVYSHPIWESATDSFYRKFEYLTRGSLSEYIFSRSSYLKYGFYDYPLAWNSDDRAWLEFSDNKPIFTISESIVLVRISNSSISGKKDNFCQKDLATLEFHKLIVLKKLKFYNKQQRKRLLDKYENTIKENRKLYLSEWFLILFSYLKYFDSYSLKKVFKRFIKSVIKHEV
ncbi:glycosyltransferase [Flavobacterium sp. GT2N3]|uniref:glycosyltransferase n=1 Tax=unclassified Flavobacterium TaxID=196869 RepID=UPI003AACC46D